MGYRSERFLVDESTGLAQVWELVDELELQGFEVANEIMAGTSYRRQLHPDTIAEYGPVNYLLQVTLDIPARREGRVGARAFLDIMNGFLDGLELPGEVIRDQGGLHGWDQATSEMPMGTGKTETEVLAIYPPWVKASWEKAGKTCLFFMGVLPPRPRRFMEEYPYQWKEREMRRGLVVFRPTPEGLETW